ncbi:MAG TPA: superoxide dismutase [Gammaproteobacteria bacterium]|nr:superoxide dismutase [Gammaproteobacteria bacterium]
MPQYVLPSLPYDLRALEPHLSSEILDLHYNKHHAAYVKGANETLEKLADARERQELGHIGQLEKSLAFHISGHVLHSLLWKNMSPDGGGTPSGELAAALDRDFGSFEGFKAQLNAAAESVQGSGWGALSWEPLGKRLVVEQVHDHQSNIGNGALPILVIDMWEHAYYLQYQNRKKEWLAAFWEVANWNDVAARFKKVQSTDIGL